MTMTYRTQLVANLDVPSQWRLGSAFVPKGRYTDLEFLEHEMERLFPRTWLNACRVDEVEQIGQYVNFEIGDESIVVLRTESGLKAYFNACRHRGTRLVSGQGRIGEFRCPFHAWRWNLDGSLKFQADAEHFEPRSAAGLCLPECRIDTWGGWVFVNLDGQAEPLEEFLDPLPQRLDGFKLEDMRIAWYKSVVLPANWKTALDAFIESWHVPGTHPQLLRPDKHATPPTIAESAQYGSTFNELFRLHSRHADLYRYGPDGDAAKLRAAYGVDPEAVYRNVEYNLRELRALYLRSDLAAAAELRTTEGGDGPDGNAIYQRLRKEQARAVGIDYPEVTPQQLKAAMYDWHLFPNTVFLIDMACCLTYRARPNGSDPNSCIFDVQGLELPPTDGLVTAPPQFFDDWRDGDMGQVLSQDFSNMSEVTAGIHSRGYDGHRLNTAQEMTIWNYHRAIDGYLFD
ncbi:MAG TPA: aromatic ring-hydroxylating dioxygenase subunit alpha [Acidimicrobiales bacterium]|jgi:phenylpropionate dioxygenase-like ring-hydroxylating dioxygenase large terminal subunit|nr:aromatic ring-hydroxylating dioxygenase subunit alpha [Acidimicrobiales bacterium]